MNLLLELFIKLEKKWILEFEIPVNPDYDNQNIQWDNVNIGKIYTRHLQFLWVPAFWY